MYYDEEEIQDPNEADYEYFLCCEDVYGLFEDEDVAPVQPVCYPKREVRGLGFPKTPPQKILGDIGFVISVISPQFLLLPYIGLIIALPLMVVALTFCLIGVKYEPKTTSIAGLISLAIGIMQFLILLPFIYDF